MFKRILSKWEIATVNDTISETLPACSENNLQATHPHEPLNTFPPSDGSLLSEVVEDNGEGGLNLSCDEK